ncbi:MAG TPA: hypothetical protein VGO85_13170 [Caldimonas sp.]|jgi:hypothetical protein|nr:hypothetical protein [Caldimonas sp.]
MLGSIKGLFARAARHAEGDAIAGWAKRAGHVYKREKDGDGFAIDGQFDAKPWRLEWGGPQRPYIDGRELRLRMVLGVPPDLQMLLMTKPLRERLAKDAFDQATQTNQTALDDTIGEETRWLVVFPKISLAGSQILRNCFAGVSSLPHEGQAWLEGPLAHGLERAAATWLNAQPPFLLMTLRGRIYLRLQLASADEGDIAAAVTLFGIAAAAARRVARARGDEPVSWAASTTSAWQSLPPASDHR